MTPLVSVVVTVYNESEHVQGSLQSILQQTFKNYEVIVVDDGSTDDSAKRALGVLEEAMRTREDIVCHFISNPANKGRAYAANAGIDMASAAIVARHDADDISQPDRLRIQYELLSQRPSVGAVGAAIIINGQVCSHPHTFGKVQLYRQMLINHPTLMFRKEWWQKACGYNEGLERCSDWDFCCRMAAAGCDFRNIPTPLVTYRQQPAEPAFYRDAKTVREFWEEEARKEEERAGE